MVVDICVDHPTAFWNRKGHTVTLPYEDNFSEDNTSTKSRPCQMNTELVEFCKKEIDNLLEKGLIKPSKSPWFCTAFYVNNAQKRNVVVPVWSLHGKRPEEEEEKKWEDHPTESHTLKDHHTDPHLHLKDH
ncbi:uncharacterized protein LOC107844306 [Capsicum annuum]|uniref:uncharacterized protein LOC107844306 n=1 Tax=Capsicum annuum TaxID=4072 RepID=UPI001FB0BC4E|nr:uncharacterized protein LOC107844306 [Capsicum annuum]